MQADFDAVLLVGYGGPTKPEEIWPFLDLIAKERSIPRERLTSVHQHYIDVGGRSPFNELTEKQAKALSKELGGTPVYIGLRNWRPFLNETLPRMVSDGVQRAVGIVLAPQRSDESFARYVRGTRDAQAAAGGPEVVFIGPWHTSAGFVEAQAQRIEEKSGYSRDNWPESVPVIFTAHSIPTALADKSRYREEIAESAAAISKLLGVTNWQVAYQSRSGNPNTPWLEPPVEDVIAALGAPEVVLAPVGFICDNVEVLYDLDIEAKHAADELSITIKRAETVGDHPAFIGELANQVRQTGKQFAGRPAGVSKD